MSDGKNDVDYSQLVKLGDMMADGLHLEPGGGWISREYRKLSRALIPEIAEKERVIRKLKNIAVNRAMLEFLKDKKCSCGGVLVQTRSGSKTCGCTTCGQKYTVSKKP